MNTNLVKYSLLYFGNLSHMIISKITGKHVGPWVKLI